MPKERKLCADSRTQILQLHICSAVKPGDRHPFFRPDPGRYRCVLFCSVLFLLCCQRLDKAVLLMLRSDRCYHQHQYPRAHVLDASCHSGLTRTRFWRAEERLFLLTSSGRWDEFLWFSSRTAGRHSSSCTRTDAAFMFCSEAPDRGRRVMWLSAALRSLHNCPTI